MVTEPSLLEDSVDLQQGCEEVINTALEIVSYFCDSEIILPTIADLPHYVYCATLKARMQVAVQVFRYSEAAGEKAWKELEARDQNEDQWTFEEEQDVIGQIGRVNAGDTCNYLVQVFEDLIKQMEQCQSEEESDLLQEQAYWVLVYVKHFVSDFDCDEIPIAFSSLTTDPHYPLLQFMDVWVSDYLFILYLQITIHC